MYYVYVLLEKDTQKTYIGFTSDLKRRFNNHISGNGAKWTKSGEWKLVYYEAYVSKQDATKRESKLKHYGQSRTHLFKRMQNSFAERK